jgi:hypothetical protein
MERQIPLYPVIYCTLLIILVVILLLLASQATAQTGPDIYDAIETLRCAI